jgi:hypothetical protein
MRACVLLSTVALFCVPGVASATVVNLGSGLGFTYDGGGSDPEPQAGQHINFIGDVPTLTLGPGTYEITNATGLPDANPDYTAWSFNLGTSSWAWAFVLATAGGTVIDYEEAGRGSSKAEVAALPAVQGFHSTFTLDAATTVAFTLRDYYVLDNGGGIALSILPVGQEGAVPEPASWATMIAGFGMIGGALRRRRTALAA